MELGVGRSRDHSPDLADLAINAQTLRFVREAEPDWAVPFERRGERAIVDESAPDGADPADAVERGAANQHASASRRGGLARRVVHPGERIKHLEEEDEGRNEKEIGRAS